MNELRIRRSVFIAAVVWVGLALPFIAEGQTPDPVADAKGLQPNHEYFSQMPFENIDAITGSLVLTFTDLVLPGHMGRDLRFQRTYNNKDRKWSFGIVGYPLYIAEPGPSPVLETPEEQYFPTIFGWDGTEHHTVSMKTVDISTLQTIKSTSNLLSTDRFWRYVRNSQHELHLPYGAFCTYEPVGVAPYWTDGWEIGLKRLKQCHSPFAGPYYVEFSILWDENRMTVTQNVEGKERRVVVELTGSGPEALPTSVTYDGDTWAYTWGSTTTVTPPEGRGWVFQVAPSSEPYSLVITTPHGGQIGYDIANTPLPGLDRPPDYMDVHSEVVTARWTLDRDGTRHEWNYRYAEEGFDTIIETPTNTRISYKTVPGTALVAQRQLSKKVGQAWVVVETENREYVDIPVINIPTVGTVLQTKELTKVDIHRDGKHYVTTYAYRQNQSGYINYGDYHNPSEIVEKVSDTIKRQTTRCFLFSDAFPVSQSLRVGVLAKEDVTVGGSTQVSEWNYGIQSPCAATTSQVFGVPTSQSRDGVVTTFSNFVQGRPRHITDANQHITIFDYTWGIPSRVQTPRHTVQREVNDDSTIKSETIGAGTPNARTTAYTYDKVQRVKTITPSGANRNVTKMDYDPDGTWVKQTRGESVGQESVVQTWLDGFGRPTKTVDSLGTTTVTRYDADGRKTFEGYPASASTAEVLGTTIEYDALGRVTKRINPAGGGTPTSVRFDYGVDSVTIHSEKCQGETHFDTVQTFEAFGSPDDRRLISVTDPMNKTWAYEYGTLGKLTKVIAHDGTVREWTYSTKGWLEEEKHPESGVTVYGYLGDNVGNVRTRTDAKGQTLSYEYDANNRVTRITGDGDPIEITYEDGSDNRAETKHGADTMRYLYDTAGRLSGQHAVSSGRHFDVRYTFDENDNLATTTYPSMRTVSFGHDRENRISSVKDLFSNKTYASEFEYHPSGALTQYRAGNDLVSTFDYDAIRYWPTRIQSGPLDVTYGDYDEVGNVRAINDSRGTAWNQTFTYDALDRLASATGPYGAITYTYDLHGNMTSQGADTFSFNPTTLQLATRNGQSIVHDLNGSIINDGGSTYTYTTRNQMASVTIGSAVSTYKYDADEWRVSKALPDGTATYYIRNPSGQLLSELTVTPGGAETRRDYVYVGSRLLAVIKR